MEQVFRVIWRAGYDFTGSTEPAVIASTASVRRHNYSGDQICKMCLKFWLIGLGHLIHN